MAWTDYLDYLGRNWRVFIDAPVPFVVSLLVGVVFWAWVYDDKVNDLKEEITRYRQEIGIEKVQNVRPLISLTNKELRKKGTNEVLTIRAIVSYHQDQYIELNARHRKREITDIQFQELREREDKRAMEELNEKVKVAAFMSFDELSKREPGAAGMLIGLPRLNPADKRDESPSLYRLFVLSVHDAGRLADNIEELVKALPD
jgi:hypothetical protein